MGVNCTFESGSFVQFVVHGEQIDIFISFPFRNPVAIRLKRSQLNAFIDLIKKSRFLRDKKLLSK